MSFRSKFLLSTALTSIGFAWIITPTIGADLPLKAAAYSPTDPAVSSPNWKIAGFGGSLDGDTDLKKYGSGLGGAMASATIPIGYQYGFQIDGTVGSWGGDSFYGTGAHLFWRDPNRAMLGVYGSWLRLDRGGWQHLNLGSGVDVATVMAQGEYYINNVTLRGMAGWEGGDVQSRFTTRVDLSFYPARDIELAAGYRYVGGNSALALRSEWLTPKPTSFTPPGGARLALFAEARIGEHQYTGAWGGLRLYFGQSQTLIDKHRRDDPLTDPNVDNLISIKTQVNKLNNLNEAAKPTSYPSDRRLKRDIILLAKLENGIGIYRYRYLWSDVVYVGVMAQEVAQIVPDAVVPMDNGYLSVDYDRLGLRIMTWNAWIRNPSIEEYPLAA